jgi:hypothetical protein
MQQEEEGKRSACAASRCREVGGRSCCYCALSASFGVFLLYSVPTAERQETLCFPRQARQKKREFSAVPQAALAGFGCWALHQLEPASGGNPVAWLTRGIRWCVW